MTDKSIFPYLFVTIACGAISGFHASQSPIVARCIENEILMYIRTNKKNQNNVSLNDSIGYDKDGNEITLEEVIKEIYWCSY